MFFSEEKNQKTFMLWRCGTIPAMALIVEQAERQKSFGSFLQKRAQPVLALRRHARENFTDAELTIFDLLTAA